MSAESNNDVSCNVIEETQQTNSNLDAVTTVDNDGRPSCKFGRQCYRQNPQHRIGMAHPGDGDYIVPDMPECNKDASKCKYGRKCYSLNPEHFKNFLHPRNINIQQNYKKSCIKRSGNRRDSDSSFDDDTEDPFAGDTGGSDYSPSEEE